jgi:uncharacterized protein (TIGR02444 family)
LSSAWAFAVGAWERVGVETICLDLQNIHGQCPALLLWRCWTLQGNRHVGRETLEKAVEIAREWDGEIICPLRALRQRLAAPFAGDPDNSRAAVRSRILEAELEAEHALFDVLEALDTPPALQGGASPLHALTDLAQAWRPPAPSAVLVRLIEAL